MKGLLAHPDAPARALLGYRLALILIATVGCWALAWDSLAWLRDTGIEALERQRLVLGIAILAGCATGIFTVNLQGRPNVSLILLPVMLAWWELGGLAAAVVAAVGTLLGNAVRMPPAVLTLAGGARLTLATFAGLAVAAARAALVGPASAEPFSPAWLADAGLFVITASLADAGLEWVDARLRATMARASNAGGDALVGVLSPPAASALSTDPADRLARTDVVTSILLLPVALLFQGTALALGVHGLAAQLGAFLALLVIVRASVNERTLRAALEQSNREILAEREKLAALFAHSGEGIYAVDSALRITVANQALADLLETPLSGVEHRLCAEVCHFEDSNREPLCPDRCPLRRAQAEQRPVTEEVIFQRVDEAPKYLLLTYAAVGEPARPLRLGIGIARDITAQKEMERLREEFISLVTHELRSPLTVSLAYIDLLRRGLQRAKAGEAIDLDRSLYQLEQVAGAERHLARLVDNLLALARVERPELELELGAVDLGQLLEAAIGAICPIADAKGIGVRVERPDRLPVLWSSELYLQEILGNLLSNAVKYTPSGGQVTVGVRVPDHNEPAAAAPYVEVDVTDTGYGIAEEEQAQLFTRFFRSGRPEVRRERGTGLGLALTKQMVERLGGSIAARSVLGAGSTFTLTLPVNGPLGAEPASADGAAARSFPA